MDRDTLTTQMATLRRQGWSIRAIASELGVSRSRVERTLRALTQTDDSSTSIVTTPGPTSPPIVGRESEIENLRTALELTVSGHGQMAVLAGEPGIGKTRIATELAQEAAGQGVQVLWGWCYDGEGAPPYWPWIQALRTYVRGATSSQLTEEMGADATNIATLLPEVHEKISNLKPPDDLEPEQARFRLFDSIATFLQKASASNPLMIVLEDLHWADRPSLLLLEFVSKTIQDSGVFLVGTYRDLEISRGHPFSSALGSLIREPNFHRIALAGLNQNEVGRFVQINGGVTLDRSDLASVHFRTGGNPLFLNELVRLVGQEEADSWTTTLPEGIKEAIGRRLDRLSDECSEVLTIGSVVGREFTFGQLRSLVDNLTEDQLWEVLEEAESNRIVEEIPRVFGRYRFTHTLVQETLEDNLSANQRIRLHARVAQALENMYRADADAHSSELAHHFFEAQRLLGTDKLVRYSLLAGEEALASYAWEEAEAHFERGINARGEGGSDTDMESGRLLFGLARAQVAKSDSYQRNAAFDTFLQAFNCFEQSGDIDSAVAVASYPFAVTIQYDTATPMIGVIERALELVPKNSLKAGLLWARLSQLQGLDHMDYRASSTALDKALSIAQQEDDADLEFMALLEGMVIDTHHLRFEECLEKGQRMIHLSDAVDSPHGILRCHSYMAVVNIFLGDSQRANYHAEMCLGLLDNYVLMTDVTNSLYVNQLLAHVCGNWELSRQYREQADEVGTGLLNLGISAVTEIELGHADEGNQIIEGLIDRATTPSGFYAGFGTARIGLVTSIAANLTRTSDYLTEGETAASVVLSSTTPVSPQTRLTAQTAAALISVLRRDEHHLIQSHYNALISERRIITNMGTTIDRVLGLLASAMKQFNAAESHFEDALAFCRKAGYRPELAWSLHDYSEMLLERHRTGDLQRALEMLDESSSIATELGMIPLTDRLSELRERVEATSAPSRQSYPDGLTQREVEVLRLIASGRTNQEIGDELFISTRTVANHVTNIFQKTDSANRAEAAAYASRLGLA